MPAPVAAVPTTRSCSLPARLQAPVAHTSRGKDALEYDNPHNIGMTGVIGMESGYQAILNCDTLLLLGTDFAWQQFYPKHATIIQVDIDPTHIGRRHPVNLGVVGNIKDTLQALLPRIQQREDSDISRHLCRSATRRLSRRRRRVRTRPQRQDSGAISGLAHRSLRERRMHCSPAMTARRWCGCCAWSRQTAGAGCSAACCMGRWPRRMSTAIGLQKAQPGRQVIAMAGDGGFTMLMGELLTTIQENLPIKIVVFDNGKLGFVELEQKGEGMVAGLHGPEESGFRQGRRSHGPVGQDGHGRRRISRPRCRSGSPSPAPHC